MVDLSEIKQKLEEFDMSPEDIVACIALIQPGDDGAIDVDEFLESVFNMNETLTKKDTMTIQANIYGIEQRTKLLMDKQKAADDLIQSMEEKLEKVVELATAKCSSGQA